MPFWLYPFFLCSRKLLGPSHINEVCSSAATSNKSGEYRIAMPSAIPFTGFCNMSADGGQWLVIQRRMDGSENFNRRYQDYADGFGNRNGEFWLGLRTLHQLTKSDEYELRIDIGDWLGNNYYATYSTFQVGPAFLGYNLSVNGYSGNAGDSLSYHSGERFSAFDVDQDSWSGNCATSYRGAFWYKACQYANVNGEYKQRGTVDPQGVSWYNKNNNFYSWMFAEMKIRKK